MEWNKQVIYTIYWDSNGLQYLYGTQLESKQDRSVFFVNELMTTGTVLSKWFSYSAYSNKRKAPGLPYLKNGETYQVKNVCKNLSTGSLFLKFTFYDFFEQIVDEQLLKNEKGLIKVPETYKFYTIELITAGSFKFEFYYMELLYKQEGLEEVGEALQLTGLLSEYLPNSDSTSRTLNVIFWEPGANLSKDDYRLINSKLSNVLLIGQANVNYDAYFDKQNQVKLQEFCEDRSKKGDKLVLWGFNRWSNYIAKAFGELLPQAAVNIGAEQLLFADVLKYKRLMSESSSLELLDQFDEPNMIAYDPQEMLKYSNYTSQLLRARLKEM